jgi:hypothetical protein
MEELFALFRGLMRMQEAAEIQQEIMAYLETQVRMFGDRGVSPEIVYELTTAQTISIFLERRGYTVSVETIKAAVAKFKEIYLSSRGRCIRCGDLLTLDAIQSRSMLCCYCFPWERINLGRLDASRRRFSP